MEFVTFYNIFLLSFFGLFSFFLCHCCHHRCSCWIYLAYSGDHIFLLLYLPVMMSRMMNDKQHCQLLFSQYFVFAFYFFSFYLFFCFHFPWLVRCLDHSNWKQCNTRKTMKEPKWKHNTNLYRIQDQRDIVTIVVSLTFDVVLQIHARISDAQEQHQNNKTFSAVKRMY